MVGLVDPTDYSSFNGTPKYPIIPAVNIKGIRLVTIVINTIHDDLNKKDIKSDIPIIAIKRLIKRLNINQELQDRNK